MSFGLTLLTPFMDYVVDSTCEYNRNNKITKQFSIKSGLT